ncbi:serine-type peptidase [Fragilaria crotonensis]|nr:serine-type peptidase [Fragilaria crotonensis]
MRPSALVAAATSASTTTSTHASSAKALTQADYRAKLCSNSKILSKDVAKLPRPGTSSPSSIKFYDADDFTSDDQTNNHPNPNGVWITYLAAEDPTSLTRKLYATNVVTGETHQLLNPNKSGQEQDFSLEEQLRRERARIMTTGVTMYAMASHTMLVPLGGALWILDSTESLLPDLLPRKLVESNTSSSKYKNDSDTKEQSILPENAPILDAKLSTDGKTVAFVCDQEVYVMPTTTTTTLEQVVPRQVTFGARGVDGRKNGVADYVAQEELERSDGFWLSPRGTRLAFEQVDESHIPAFRITHQGEAKGLSPTLKTTLSCADVAEQSTVTHEEHRYPFAGAQNPKVKLGVVPTNGHAIFENDNVLWFDLDQVFGDDFYLAKVEWLSTDADAGDSTNDESTKLVVQLLDRRQKKLALLLLDATTGSVSALHVEEAMEGAWINLNDGFRVLQSNDESMRFLWASERDGYRHLYILDASLVDESNGLKEAKIVRRLTGPDESIVDKVLGLDETHVYYMGTSPGRWLESHMFRVKLNGEGTPELLTGAVPGMHSCVLNLNARLYVDSVSTVDQPTVVAVYKLPSASETVDESIPAEQLLQLHDAGKDDNRVSALALKPPTFHTFPSTDGQVTLQAAVYLPDEDIHGKGPWPLVVATYGGPHVQYVQNTWGMMTADLRSQFLRANGFAVIKVDNRGSNRRGLVFEAPIYGNMGAIEVEDQVAGVEWAVQQGIARRNQVAVSGWSYGGYMALKCLAGRPDVFHAAVSGAPVTDWTLYDTAYTERYMGLPQENPDGYAKSSALSEVRNIDGSLLLCHGLLDENVLFRHSAVLINALIEEQKAYDLALFPSERHGPRREQDRAFLEERILAFLQRSLGV